MICNETIQAAQAALLQGNFALSERLYQEVLHEEADNICALDGLAVLLCQKGETEDGILLFQQALQFLRQRPIPNANWESSLLFHLGLSYRTLGLRQKALQVFEEAAKLTPHEADLFLNLGQIYYELENYSKAAEQFQTLVVLQADSASAWLTLGFILLNLDRCDEAAETLRTAVLLDSESPEASFYLAEALRRAERYKESLPYYQRMLQIGTEYPQAVHGYGKTLLALGNFQDGWDAMEFRLASTIGNWERHHLPHWSPEINQDVSCVLAYSEGGIATELMFASCLPDMINSVKHCVVECESSLHSLFKRSFPRAEFVPLAEEDVRPGENAWNIPLDAQVAFGSLPRYFRCHREDFPIRKAYLVPDKEHVARWHTRLAGLGDAKKIGILWKGTWTQETSKQTSLPLQELWNMMTQHQEAAWVCLQHGSHQQDFQQQRGNFWSPKIFPEAFQYDLDSMAALLTALDLVITPPGYIAHLAGALGVRTWLLLPEGADWRHMIDVTGNNAAQVRSVWHPSVKMYRQAKEQTWQNFFAHLDDDLEKFLITFRPPEESPATLLFTESKTAAFLKSA